MSRMISFVVHGEAIPQGSKTTGVTKTGRRFVRPANPRLPEWRMQVAQAAGEAMGNKGCDLMRGPVAVTTIFMRVRPKSHLTAKGVLRKSAPPYPTMAPDTHKLMRAVEDAMTGIVYADDAQITDSHCLKRYGPVARVEIAVEEIEG